MHHYDDPEYNYQTYWKHRNYEHQSEILAINHLLSGYKFSRQVDIGGGFGRLFPTFLRFCKHIYLLEPSRKLRLLANRLYPKNPHLKILHSLSHRTPFKAGYFDLVSLIRVSHHLPNLEPTFSEIYRILKPNGVFLLEFANSANFKSQLINFLQPVPQIPIEKRSSANIRRQTIAFVNHHPNTIKFLLTKHGFTIEKTLSVSNFRSPLLKRIFPLNWLIWLESILQPLLAGIFFGPSIFILAKKASTKPNVDNSKIP